MQFVGALFLVLVLPLGVESAASDHPIGKVISLLESLQAKITAEAKDEEDTFNKFQKWCDTSFATLDTAIAARTADIERFTIDESTAQKKKNKANDEVNFLTSEIDKLETANTKAAQDRQAEANAYNVTRTDFVATVAAIQEALDGLNNSKNTSAGMSMTQLRGSSDPAPAEDDAWALTLMQKHPSILTAMTVEQQEELTAAASGDQSLMQINGPPSEQDILDKAQYGKSQTYTFKSGGAMGMLENLIVKFNDKIKQADNQETFKLSQHNNAQTARTDAINVATDTRDNVKVINRQNAQTDENTGRTNKETAQSDKDADTALRKETKADCDLKKSEYDSRYNTRFGEMAAMTTAIKILTKVTKVEAPPTLFLQVAAQNKIADPRLTKMMNLINMQASKSHSKDFSSFAAKMARRVGLGGTFDGINKEIQKMIFRLIGEQKTEKEHKVWCDKEYYNTNTTNNTQTEHKADLVTKMGTAESEIAALVVVINDLVTLNHNNEQEFINATAERKASKAAHMKTIQDSKDAQDALAKATAALTAFYKESGAIAKESWEALVQTSHAQDPTTGTAQGSQATSLTPRAATDAAEYSGQGDSTDPTTGILAVLTDTAGDFAVMETNCKQAESSDQGVYEELEKTYKQDKAQNEKDIEMKKEQQQRLKTRIKKLKAGIKKVSDSLWNTAQYLAELTPACISGDASFDERQAARDAEIVSLKLAKKTLAEAHMPTAQEIEAQTNATLAAQLAHEEKIRKGHEQLAADKATDQEIAANATAAKEATDQLIHENRINAASLDAGLDAAGSPPVGDVITSDPRESSGPSGLLFLKAKSVPVGIKRHA